MRMERIEVKHNYSKYLVYGALALMILYFLLLHSYTLFRYPFQEGSDLLFHNWVIGSINENGSIPATSPTSTGPNLYQQTPLFHILMSTASQLTGLPTPYALAIFNILIVAIFCSLLFLLGTQFFKNPIIGLLMVGYYFFMSDELFFYNVPRNFILIVFLLAILFIIKYLDTRKNKYLALLFITVTALLLFHHITSLSVLTVLVGISLALSLLAGRRMQSILLLSVLLLSSILILFLVLSTSPDLPIDTSDTAFNGAGVTVGQTNSLTSILSQPLSYIFQSLLWFFIIIGLIAFVVQSMRTQLYTRLLFISGWAVSSLLLIYQFIGGYNFFSERNYKILLPIACLFAAYGTYFFLRRFPSTYPKSALITVVMLSFIFFYITSNFLAPTHTPIHDGIARKNIQELLRIRERYQGTTVLSDPYTMYLLTSIAGMKPAYAYEYTDLTRNKFINWDETKKLFYTNDASKVYDYVRQQHADIIIISAKTRKYFYDTSFKVFEENDDFTLVYESQGLDQQNFPEQAPTRRYPYYQVYKVVLR